jgi:hypothetical protein
MCCSDYLRAWRRAITVGLAEFYRAKHQLRRRRARTRSDAPDTF